MADKDESEDVKKPKKRAQVVGAKAEERRLRQAESLRANLLRRKKQLRARTEGDDKDDKVE